MKKKFGVLVAIAMAFGMIAADAYAERLVILTTNDTHSQIDPDYDGKGGVLRRKVIIDSVRAAEKNVLLIDAGDAVQGTLYFTLFGGKVEFALIDSLKYDAYTLGNHEFDNGMEPLAEFYKNMKTQRVSANYDLTNTPIAGMFKPYIIKEYAGKRIGIMGINLLPTGMIDSAKCVGVTYLNSMAVANTTAAYLKNVENVDFVIMLSHVGYSGGTDDDPSDMKIVASSRDIDLVIGGHSHTVINPADKKNAWLVKNADGREIPVTQTGASGKNLGYIALDLDNMKIDQYKLMPVDKRYDSRAVYPALNAFIAPYKAKVDSIMNMPAGYSKKALARDSEELHNYIADATFDIVENLYGKKVDMAVANSGGIRCPMPEGMVSVGLVLSMLPFDNKLVVLEIKGKDLLDAFTIMASRGGSPLSKHAYVEYKRADSGAKAEVVKATINGKEVDPEATYYIATIDYLANGGDYLVPLKKCARPFVDTFKFGERVLEYIKQENAKGKMIDPVADSRMKQINK